MIKIFNGTIVQWPYSMVNLRIDHPNTSFPPNPNATTLAEFGVVIELPTPVPMYNPLTQMVAEDTPSLVAGVWTQQWLVTSLPPEVIAANQLATEQNRVQSLWQAAHDKEFDAISGSAIGLITLGVLQNKPKCLAVQGWIQSIWTEYYVRKAGTSTDTDYSMAGECPHTVPELMVELGF